MLSDAINESQLEAAYTVRTKISLVTRRLIWSVFRAGNLRTRFFLSFHSSVPFRALASLLAPASFMVQSLLPQFYSEKIICRGRKMEHLFLGPSFNIQ